MKTNALLALALTASALMTCAQEPRVTHTQYHSGPMSLGLSATVDRFRHSNEPLWLGYAVQALPRTHLSACSSWTGSSEVEDGCCNELRLEDTPDNLNTSRRVPVRLRLLVCVLLRLDHGEVTRVRMARAGCTLDAGGVAFEFLTDVQAEDSAAFLGKLAASAAALHDTGDHRGRLAEESLVVLSMHATPKATRCACVASPPPEIAITCETRRLSGWVRSGGMKGWWRYARFCSASKTVRSARSWSLICLSIQTPARPTI